MPYPQEQIQDLINTFGVDVTEIHEGGYEYVYIRGLKMPAGCTPNTTDVLFCPVPHFSANYESRLFFKDQVQHPNQIPGRPNWLQSQYILGRQWYNFSYRGVVSGSYSDMVLNHLRGLYK